MSRNKVGIDINRAYSGNMDFSWRLVRFTCCSYNPNPFIWFIANLEAKVRAELPAANLLDPPVFVGSLLPPIFISHAKSSLGSADIGVTKGCSSIQAPRACMAWAGLSYFLRLTLSCLFHRRGFIPCQFDYFVLPHTPSHSLNRTLCLCQGLHIQLPTFHSRSEK